MQKSDRASDMAGRFRATSNTRAISGLTGILFPHSFSYGVIIQHRWVWLYSPRKASFNNNIVLFSFLREVSMPCSDIYFSLLCFAYGFKNLNGKFPWLNKNYVSGSFTSFLTSQARRQVSLSWSYICSLFFACLMAVKLETGVLWDLIKTLFLVLFLRL